MVNGSYTSGAGYDEEQQKKQKQLLTAMHLNKALCYLKINMNKEARKECNKVLEKDPENEKALFRRGQVSVCRFRSQLVKNYVLLSQLHYHGPFPRIPKTQKFCL